MIRKLEELGHLWPLVCALIGASVVESNFALFPWKALGLMMMFVAVVYVVVPIWRMTKGEEK